MKYVSLTTKQKDEIVVVASDPMVQVTLIRAMLHGYERGTDLWEALEMEASKLRTATHVILWGSEYSLDPDDEDQEEVMDCLYKATPPHDVIGALLDKVEENVLHKIEYYNQLISST